MRSNPNRGKGNDSALPCEPENSSSDIGMLYSGRCGCILSFFVSSDPAARAVFEHRIREGVDLQIEIDPSPYVNAEIFERYVDAVLIPAVEANRQLPGCDKKPAILFCDNCSAHMSNSTLEK
jgi:hypothetical protein